MHGERLTRQELAWLLTQEARGAADKLRKGVANLAGAEIRGAAPPARPGFESELNTLDDAMKMLASLNANASHRGRRGRIDLAALLWDLAPNARVSIEPGSGTEVFGDESELRRILQVLIGITAPTGGGASQTPELAIRGDGEHVRITVTLGPDPSANVATERAWLHRMATRYGGRLELEGGKESLVFPAQADSDREVASLRRELEAAQRQGEAYARELAVALSQGEEVDDEVAPASTRSAGTHWTAITRFAAGLLPGLKEAVAILDASNTPGARERLVEQISSVAAIANCPSQETSQVFNLNEAIVGLKAVLGARAAERGVSLALALGEPAAARGPRRRMGLLVHGFLSTAVAQAPAGARLVVSTEGSRVLVSSDPPIPIVDSWTEMVAPESGGQVYRKAINGVPTLVLDFPR